MDIEIIQIASFLAIPLLGIALTYIGYGPLSFKKNPTAGIGFVVFGFLLRVAGPLILALTALFLIFIFSMIEPA